MEENSTFKIEEVKGQIPSKRLAHTMSTIGNDLYLYGGRLQNEEEDLSDFYKFETKKNEWSVIKAEGESPKNRSYHSATTIGDYLFIFGGCQHNNEGTHRKNDLHSFNTKDLTWKKIEAKNEGPSIRGGTTICSIGNTIYLHGGFSGKELDDFYSLNLEELTWKKIDANGDIPSARSVHTLLKVGNNLVTFGGEKEPSKKGHEGAGFIINF
jgi:N-acetylneuraminic acid mutarotase